MEYNISGQDSLHESNILDVNSIIGFGKYKGKTVGALLKYIDGVNYLKWATNT